VVECLEDSSMMEISLITKLITIEVVTDGHTKTLRLTEKNRNDKADPELVDSFRITDLTKSAHTPLIE
jgi:hypothetical protein